MVTGPPRLGIEDRHARGGRTPLGLPDGPCVLLSNSERTDAACALRWRFRYAEGLASPGRDARDLGAGWALWMAALRTWWQRTDRPYPVVDGERCPACAVEGLKPDCSQCDGAGRGPVERARVAWSEDEASRPGGSTRTSDELDDLADLLQRATAGYLRRWGPSPPPDVRVVGVEVALARPILGPTGAPYAPEVPVVAEDDDGRSLPAEWPECARVRAARATDPEPVVRWVRWPWYYAGVLDGVGQDRATGALWDLEDKFVGQPEAYLAGLSVDPQTTGYLWLLEHAARSGAFAPLEVGDVAHASRPVAGYLYEVAQSVRHRDPELLKAGGLSQRRGVNTPSWRYRDALASAGLDLAPYAEHLAHLEATVDGKLYRREPGFLDRADLDRFGVEAYAVARRHAQLRRDACRAGTPAEVAACFPRTPVCRLPGGGCAFRGPCVRDTPEARSRLVGSGPSDGVFPDPAAEAAPF